MAMQTPEPRQLSFVPTDPGTCKHPAHRLYSGWYYDPELDRRIMWIACCDCGSVLSGRSVIATRRDRRTI